MAADIVADFASSALQTDESLAELRKKVRRLAFSLKCMFPSLIFSVYDLFCVHVVAGSGAEAVDSGRHAAGKHRRACCRPAVQNSSGCAG